MAIASRDYAEKSFMFYDRGKFYRFTSGVPDSEFKRPNGRPPICPLPDYSTVRAFTFINIATCYRNPSDGKIIYSSVVQFDFKLKIPNFMLTTFVPRAIKAWMENIQKYYNKNHKQLGLTE